MGLVVYPQPAGITAAEVWSYANRDLTRTKFPFWSAIITQAQGSVSVASSTWAYVNIQPPSGETWYIGILIGVDQSSSTYPSRLVYGDYDGTTFRKHSGNYLAVTNYAVVFLTTNAILTNSLYGRIGYYRSGTTTTGTYGYSGFKLSQPQWSPQSVLPAMNMPFKRPAESIAFPQLADRAYLNPDGKVVYHLISEVLAVDPVKGDPVETVEYHVLEEDLVKNLATFRADPKSTGWDKIFAKLKEEGITL